MAVEFAKRQNNVCILGIVSQFNCVLVCNLSTFWCCNLHLLRKKHYSTPLRATKMFCEQLKARTRDFIRTLEFFLNGAELSLNSVNSEKLINH